MDQALAEQRESGEKLGNALVSIGALDELVLADVLGSFFGLVSLNLRRENIDRDALLLIPEEVARENLVVPVRFGEGGLHVAVAEPSDELSALLARTTGHSVRLMIAPLSDIRWAIDSNYRALGNVDRLVQASSGGRARKRNVHGVEAEILGDNAPVVQVVDRI